MREMSRKNPYWLEKNRRLELTYFCRQYPIWQKALAAITGLQERPADLEVFAKTGQCSDPVAKAAIAREKYLKWIRMVNTAAEEAGEDLADFLIQGICYDMSYEELETLYGVPVCRCAYYKMYAKFFYELNKLRD